MPRPLDHHLHAPLPGPLGELAQDEQLLDLGPVSGIGQRPGPHPVAQADRHLIFGTERKQPVILFVERVFPVIAQHPFANSARPGDDVITRHLGPHPARLSRVSPQCRVLESTPSRRGPLIRKKYLGSVPSMLSPGH